MQVLFKNIKGKPSNEATEKVSIIFTQLILASFFLNFE